MAEKYPFNFAAFDFSGCGKSEGEFITYGEEQVEDIHTVMSFLMNKHGIKTLFLWGRRYKSNHVVWELLWGYYMDRSIRVMLRG